MEFDGKRLNQGSFSKDREEMVMLILSKDDIRGYAEERDIKLSEKDVDDVMNMIARKGIDLIMEDFWQVVEVFVDKKVDERETIR
jgi:hypothetical protein